jgi:spore germination cell wall hydrolase CwlJ-like protein
MIDALLIGLVALGGLFAFPRRAQGSFPEVAEVTNPAQISQGDLDTLARTIWGEARGDGYEGMQAVANVIMNRYRLALSSTAKARQFGGTVSEICLKPYQFSAWLSNDPNLAKMLNVTRENAAFRVALSISQRALEGRLPDITNGADHYHTAAVEPFWSKGETPVASIRSHRFFRLA